MLKRITFIKLSLQLFIHYPVSTVHGFQNSGEAQKQRYRHSFQMIELQVLEKDNQFVHSSIHYEFQRLMQFAQTRNIKFKDKGSSMVSYSLAQNQMREQIPFTILFIYIEFRHQILLVGKEGVCIDSSSNDRLFIQCIVLFLLHSGTI